VSELLFNALRMTGASGLYATLVEPAGVVILMYHSVAGEDAAACIDPANRVSPVMFERQMEFLASRRAVVSIERVVEGVLGRAELPVGAVAVTFDDGYLDTLTRAAPVLARLKIPATLFLPTAYIDRGAPQWIDRVYAAFTSRTRHRLTLPGVLDVAEDLSIEPVRRGAHAAVCRALLGAGLGDRDAMLDEIELQLSPGSRPDRTTMTWDDVARLRREFPSFTLGGHTVTHRDLSRCDADESLIEIRGSLDRIESQTGERSRVLSFPYGRASEASLRGARAAGVVGAVASGSIPRARQGTDPLRMSRIAATESLSALASFTHASYPDLPLTLLGRV